MSNDRSPASAEGDAADHQNESDVVGDLDENVAGMLCYLLLFVTGLVFYLIEDHNDFVRFHAAQSIVVFGGLAIASFGSQLLGALLGGIPFPFVGAMFSVAFGGLSAAIGLAILVLWIVLLIKAYEGERFHVPIAGPIAEDLV